MLQTRATGALYVHFCAPKAGPFGILPFVVYAQNPSNFGLEGWLALGFRCRVVGIVCLVPVVSVPCLSLSLSLALFLFCALHSCQFRRVAFLSGIIRSNWNDPEKINIAPSNG